MHYRNGREAHNGDKCIKLGEAYVGDQRKLKIEAVGVLFDAKAGDDYCNGSIASTLGGPVVGACICDMLHMDDVEELFTSKGWNKRPPGK